MKKMIETFDGYELYANYDPVENAVANVIFSHGFVEYGAHYSKLAKMFHAHGFNVLRYDMRAHGRSTMPLGDISDAMDFTLDLNACVHTIKEINDLPVFILGFSLGGMVSALYALLYPFEIEGCALIGAGVEPVEAFANLSKNAYSVMEFLEMMGTPGDDGIKQLVAMDSPYVIKEATARFLKQSLYEAPRFIRDNIVRYSVPTLLVHGRLDPMIPVSSSISLYEMLPIDDKELLILEDQYHDLLRVSKAQEVVDAIAMFYLKHL